MEMAPEVVEKAQFGDGNGRPPERCRLALTRFASHGPTDSDGDSFWEKRR
jgi:hypothetical protein